MPHRGLGHALGAALVAVGLRRRRNASGGLEPRAWGRLAVFVGSVVAADAVWTSLHIVAPGTVGVRT